jgi:hypothetical protein
MIFPRTLVTLALLFSALPLSAGLLAGDLMRAMYTGLNAQPLW